MSRILNIAEAKAHLSEIVTRAAGGEEIIIARNGRPLVKLVPLAKRQQRRPGAWAHLRDLLDPEAVLAPSDLEDMEAAEGAGNDEFGKTRR